MTASQRNGWAISNVSNSAARAITLNAGGGTFDTNGFDSTINQGIAGVGGLTKAGNGTLTLLGVNTYKGGTKVTGGAIKGKLPSTGSIVLDGGTIDLANGTLTVDSLSGRGGTLNLGSNTLVIDQDGDTIFAGALTGSGALVKRGKGTLTLSGANTLTGTTTVSAGRLSITGSLASDVTVGPGGKVDGNGAITGRVSPSSP